jgi:hypothetical protein
MGVVSIDAYQTDAELFYMAALRSHHLVVGLLRLTYVCTWQLIYAAACQREVFYWLSRYLIAAFGNAALDGIGNA